MQFEIEIQGVTPLIMCCASTGLDAFSAANIEKTEIARKKGSNRTKSDELRLRELDCQTSLWLDCNGSPYVPERALRTVIEQAARKLKQGPQVREGLLVKKALRFKYDEKKYGKTLEELSKYTQFTTDVVIQKSRVLKTRAKFDKWGIIFIVEVDDELVSKEQLAKWLDIAGRRIGLGAWRPAKSGIYGTFSVLRIKELSAV